MSVGARVHDKRFPHPDPTGDHKSVPGYVLEANKVRDAREWRRLKRRQIRAAKKAVQAIFVGSAFLVRGSSGSLAAIEAELNWLLKWNEP